MARLLAIVLSLSLAYSSAGGGINWAVIAALEQGRRVLRPHFTEAPKPVFRGAEPRRDPVFRAGLWNERTLRDLARVRLQALLEEPENLWACIESPGLLLQAGGGEGGGGSEGEGGGSGGGSGGTSGGGSGGEGGGGGGSGSGSGSGGGFGLGGTTNTNTGNRLSRLALVSWPARGDVGVGLTLYHNSLTQFVGAFGHGWSCAYETKFDYTPGSSSILRWGDGTTVPYSEDVNGFVPPAGFHEAMVRNPDQTWTVTTKSQWLYLFNASGFLTAIKDRAGNTVSVGRDANNKLTTVTDPSGRQLAFTYTGSRITSVSDPAGRTWSFAYSAANDLTSIIYPLLEGQNPARTLTYDAGHNILSETDLRGNVWTCIYDTQERLVVWRNPHNNTTTYAYGPTATTITLPGGQQIVHNYSSGLLASEVDAAGFSESYLYDAAKNVTQFTDKRGKVWVFTYDTKANLLTARNPLLKTWTLTYSAANDLQTFRTPLNHTTTFTYSPTGKVATVVDPLGRTRVSNAYDTYGQLLTTQDALGRMSSLVYDAHGNATSVTDPAGAVWTLGYNTLGRALSITDSLANLRAFGYDNWMRLVSATQPGGGTVSAQYDREGNLTAATDELNRTGTLSYDASGRLTGSVNARGDAEGYAYNLNSWLTSVTNGRGYVRTYGYSSRGEPVSLTMPDGAFEQWSYNADGDVSGYSSPIPFTISYAYDDAGRVTLVDYPTGTDTALSYDDSGRRTSMADSTGTTAWTWDAGSQLTQLSTPQGVLQYAYNLSGQRTAMTDVGTGTTSYAYDSAGRLASLTNPFGEVTSLQYDALSRPTRKTFATGAYEEFGYDARSRPVSLILKNSANQVLSSQSYVFDVASQILTSTRDGVATSYAYDAIGQLLSETKPGYSASYSYDSNCNRASRTVNGLAETYANDAGDKLTSVTWTGGSKTFAYDASGRTTSVASGGVTRTFAYDFESRITSIATTGQTTNTFGYSGFDTRVAKTDSTGTRTYLRSGTYVTAPVLADGQATYTPGVSERRGSTTSYQHSALKNAELQSGSAQTFSATKGYDAFGNPLSGTGSWQGPFGYGGPFGYQSDPDTGLMLLGHRYYDPSVGRFLTRDEAHDGNNWYRYCENSPVALADPSGNLPIVVFFIAAAFILATDNAVAPGFNDPSYEEMQAELGAWKIDATLTVLPLPGGKLPKIPLIKKPPAAVVGGAYKLVNTEGKVVYVGSTNDFERRLKEHLRKFFDVEMERVFYSDDRKIRRAVEQVIFENELGNGSPLTNKIRPVSGRSPLMKLVEYYRDN